MAARKKAPIKLGDRVRDTVTGFTGITILYTEYLDSGPVWGVAGERCGTDGLPIAVAYIDAWRIEKAPAKAKRRKK